MLTKVPSNLMPVEKFQVDLEHICGAFQVQPTKDQKVINGAVLLEQRAGFDVAHVAENLQTIKRTKREIRRDPGENYYLIVQEQGKALMSQRDTVRMLVPGDMMLVDSTIPSGFTFFGNYSRQLSIHIPRTELQERFSSCLKGGEYLSRNDHCTMALYAVLSKAFDDSVSCNETQSSYLREAMFGLLGAKLWERTDGTNLAKDLDVEISGAQTLDRGMAYIDRFYADNELTIQLMADDLGTSIRQLQRAFTMFSSTPTDYLLQKRMEKACQLLLARQNGNENCLVSTIAYSCGFNDVSYFNRVFRKSFGCAPGQYGNNFYKNLKVDG